MTRTILLFECSYFYESQKYIQEIINTVSEKHIFSDYSIFPSRKY